MTKVVSLSKKAYQTLKDLKRPNESFSDVVQESQTPNKKNQSSNLQEPGRATT